MTVKDPRPTVRGLVALHDEDWMPELSEDVKLNTIVASVETPLCGDRLKFPGQVTFGGDKSITDRGKEQELALPALSVAVHTTATAVET